MRVQALNNSNNIYLNKTLINYTNYSLTKTRFRGAYPPDSFVKNPPVENDKLTKEKIIDAFNNSKKIPFSKDVDATQTKIYNLLQELGLTDISKIIEQRNTPSGYIYSNLPQNASLLFRYSEAEEFFNLHSIKTPHKLTLYTFKDELLVDYIKDQNHRSLPSKTIDKLSNQEFEVLKNSLNYFKSFEEISPAEESKNYLSLGKLTPKHKGIIYEKIKQPDGSIKKVPIEVDIKKTDGNHFHFFKGEQEIGDLELYLVTKEELANYNLSFLKKDYPDYGIEGERIIVEFVENRNPHKYVGIGHLADMIEVACCNELGIKPVIISLSLNDAVPIHYNRGKRFIPFELYDKRLATLYQSTPDQIAENLANEKNRTGRYAKNTIVDGFLMYMPKDLIEKCEKELEEHPIF